WVSGTGEGRRVATHSGMRPPKARSASARRPIDTGVSPPGPRLIAASVRIHTRAGNAATIFLSDHIEATRTRNSDQAPAARTLIGSGTGPTYMVSHADASTQLAAAPTASSTRAIASSAAGARRTDGAAAVTTAPRRARRAGARTPAGT